MCMCVWGRRLGPYTDITENVGRERGENVGSEECGELAYRTTLPAHQSNLKR